MRTNPDFCSGKKVSNREFCFGQALRMYRYQVSSASSPICHSRMIHLESITIKTAIDSRLTDRGNDGGVISVSCRANWITILRMSQTLVSLGGIRGEHLTCVSVGSR